MSTNQNCEQIKMALIAVCAVLLINNRRVCHQKPNMHCKGCISGKGD